MEENINFAHMKHLNDLQSFYFLLSILQLFFLLL